MRSFGRSRPWRSREIWASRTLPLPSFARAFKCRSLPEDTGRVEAGQATPRPPLRAFRDEIEERRKVLVRPRPGAVGLSPTQRKFVDQALLEFVAKGGDLGTTKVVSNQIRDLPPEIATQLLLLIQNRYLAWVKTGDVDVALSHGTDCLTRSSVGVKRSRLNEPICAAPFSASP